MLTFLGHALALFAGHLDRSDVVEGLLRKVVMLALEDLAEASHRVGDLHVYAVEAGELLGHEERLCEETLDLASARHRELVVLGELVHA